MKKTQDNWTLNVFLQSIKNSPDWLFLVTSPKWNFGLAGKKVEEGEIDHIGEDLIRAENIVSSSGRCVWLDTQGTTDGGHQSGLGGIGWTFLHVCGEGDNPGLSETVFSKL